MSDMLEKLREWTAEAEKLEAANERFAQEVAEIEKAAAQADALPAGGQCPGKP